jgi:hypothetical protein
LLPGWQYPGIFKKWRKRKIDFKIYNLNSDIDIELLFCDRAIKASKINKRISDINPLLK